MQSLPSRFFFIYRISFSKRVPKKLVVSVSRRSRRYCTKVRVFSFSLKLVLCCFFQLTRIFFLQQPKDWVPTIKNPFHGSAIWVQVERIDFITTLYRDGRRSNEFDDKEWTIAIEEVGTETSGPSARRRVLATAPLRLSEFVKFEPTPEPVSLSMRPQVQPSAVSSLAANRTTGSGKTHAVRRLVVGGQINFSISCTLIKEGAAT